MQCETQRSSTNLIREDWKSTKKILVCGVPVY